MKIHTVLVISLLICSRLLDALVHKLEILEDEREIFKIESFVFAEGGVIDLEVKDIRIIYPAGEMPDKVKQEGLELGLVLVKALSESKLQQKIELAKEKQQCIFDSLSPKDIVAFDLADTSKWGNQAWTFKKTLRSKQGTGLYGLVFVRCKPKGTLFHVSFELDAVFKNPGYGNVDWDFLSAGDTPLPTVYMIFFGIFGIMLLLWVRVIQNVLAERTTSSTAAVVQRIHYMMLVLLVLKCFVLLFESIRYHHISAKGTTDVWSLVYYVFATLKGIMLFTVILLIGSGWSTLKQMVNAGEKKLIFAVLIGQIVLNISMVVVEETAPGSESWVLWRDILHLVDIICACVILVPIMWSIKHLQNAAEVDVVSYVYFTRIIVFIVASTVSPQFEWVAIFATESASAVFYCWTGYNFRPVVDNPYLKLNTETDDDVELSDMVLHSIKGEGIGFGLGGEEHIKSNIEL